MEKLSSGLVNRQGDDATGLAISEKMRLNWGLIGLRNAQDAISLIQTANFNEWNSQWLQRIRELAVQSSNATNNKQDSLQKEVSQLSEIDRIGNNTEFNTKKLRDFQVHWVAEKE